MMTSTTFILAITTAGRPPTELQAVQISVSKSYRTRLRKVNIYPQTGRRRLYPNSTSKQKVIGYLVLPQYYLATNSIVTVYCCLHPASRFYVGAFTVMCSSLPIHMHLCSTRS